ncbi:MAG: hypothetical protein R2939_12655 [Kofleriaceae bacterium]
MVTNTWLGLLFMTVIAIGALEAIPRDLLRGGRRRRRQFPWQRFTLITLPHLRVGMAPRLRPARSGPQHVQRDLPGVQLARPAAAPTSR